MNTKIKLLGLTLITLAGVFAGANIVSAQSVNATCTSATFIGSVTPNGYPTTAWFEWGTTTSFGSVTASQVFTVNSNFEQIISGLTGGTTYYYRAMAQNSEGTATGATISYNTPLCVVATPQPTVSISADQTNVSYNNGTTIRFNTNNATSCSASGGANGWSGARSTSGGSFNTGSLTNTTTYSITCSNNSGSVSDSVTVNVSQQVNQPTVSLSADQTNVSYNNGTYIRWYTNNATSCSASGGANNWQGAQNVSGGNFYTGALTNTTTYFINCSNSSGSAQSSVTVNVGSQQVFQQQNTGVAPSTATLLATEITGTSAKLNGLVFTSSSQSSNAWFEWGTNTNVSNKTQTFSVGTLPSIKHSDFIIGLVSGQVYYYRIVAENTYGKAYGALVSFTAESATQIDTTVVINTPTRIIRNVTVINRGGVTQSLVNLTIDGGAEVIVSGEKRLYRVAWENTSGQSLKNVVLRITLPVSMNFESTSAGAFSLADNTVTVDVKSLAIGEKGEVFISAVAIRNITTGELVIVIANMVYTDTKGVQNDAVAYVTHRGVSVQNASGANIFGVGEFLPTTLFEWLILIILILILILLGNHLYGRFSDEKKTKK